MKNKEEKLKSGFFNIVWFYYKKYKWMFISLSIIVLITSISRVIQPKILNELLLSISTGEGLVWWGWSIIMIILLFVVAIFTFLSTWVAGKLGKKIEIEVRKTTISNLINQDMSFYSNKKSGETLTKVISDTSIVGTQSQRVPVQILSAFFMVVGGAIVLFTIDWRLTLITLGMTVLIMLIIVFSFSNVRKRMLESRKVVTRVNGEVSDKIGVIGLIKSSGTEEKENELFDHVHKDYYDSYKKTNISLSFVMTAFTAGVMSISIVVVISSMLLYHDDPSKLIVLPSFLTGISLMISPIIQMASLSQGLAQATTSTKRINELTSQETKIDLLEKENKKVIEKLDGNIVFKDVEFSYPEKPEKVILPKMSFTFEKGKSYAFVGETGVGKSTISKLLLRFYDVSKGEILLNNNIPLKDVYMPSYLRRVGYVEQEPQIIYGNVKDNVAYGLDDVTNKQIAEACKKAKLDEIIQKWENKYDTILGERGITLSGGQKQRLIIARMFLKNPDLLILDEATSALDNIVESEINAQLEELSKGKTVIVIAHRLSTIKNVDKIIVLKSGEGIVETGSFKELKNKKGYFRDLYEAGLME